MRAVVGLGNPGFEYVITRHNLGFWVVERILSDGRWQKEIFPWGEVFKNGENLILRPRTFMNLSGQAVAEFCRLFQLAPAALLIVYDDVDLPLGEIRLRPKGGPGTHRGMQSVLSALGTEEVPRLRVGIGPPPKEVDLAQFVLSPPKLTEIPILEKACDLAAELARTFLVEGLASTLAAFSRKSSVRSV